ncbi:MAG: hypothetical protein ACPH06_07865 [Flavobacteriaceae bacterium]
MKLKIIYENRFNLALKFIVERLEKDLCENLNGIPRIDRISIRAKSIDRFLKKSKKILDNGSLKYNDPINQIQDQIGARVIVLYLDDVKVVETELKKYYTPIEEQKLVPDSEKEFDYEGKHFVLLLPSDVLPEDVNENLSPQFFELQIKTLYQHAFSEASHDLAYKPEISLTREQKRKVAFTSAQSWGADQIFSELSKELLN